VPTHLESCDTTRRASPGALEEGVIMKAVGVLAMGSVLSSLLVVGCALESDATRSVNEDLSDSSHVKSSSKTAPGSGPLLDRDGDVLAHSNTYAIVWGPASAFPADEVAGVRAPLGGFGGSYLAIANQYMRAPATSPTTSYVATSVYESASEKFVTSAPPAHAPKASELGAQGGALYGTPDPNGIYFFFTSKLPNVSYCAWHSEATCTGVTFQVGYMPNMATSPGCSPFTVKNLGCNTYSEATQSLLEGLAHEFMEATTDPHLDAWLDKSGSEIGDKCNFVYGSCVSLPNGNELADPRGMVERHRLLRPAVTRNRFVLARSGAGMFPPFVGWSPNHALRRIPREYGNRSCARGKGRGRG
jgi:hypothetical protein